MNINKIGQNQYSFKAKFINCTSINKFDNASGKFIPENVNWLKFDRKNLYDVVALSQAAKNWQGEKFASNIAYMAMLMSERFLKNEPCEIFILTNQKEDFDNLDNSQIIGMAEINKETKDTINLNYIEVDPTKSTLNINSKYKKIGSRMLDLLKARYANCKIKLTADAGSVSEFYRKNGFECTNEKRRTWEWQGN